VTAQTTHFSSGFLVLLDKPGTAKDLSEYFTNYITGRSGVKQPGCGDERSPRDAGVKVTSDRGDRVLWCFGQEDGRRVLKVSNNTRTFAEVTYPSRWKVLDAFSVSLDTDTIARYFGSKAPTQRPVLPHRGRRRHPHPGPPRPRPGRKRPGVHVDHRVGGWRNRLRGGDPGRG